MNITAQPESFLAGLVVGLVVLVIIWLIADRKALKAQLVALEAKATPAVKAIEHDVHLVEAVPKVALADIEALFTKGMADIRAEAARIEAAKVPATNAPTV